MGNLIGKWIPCTSTYDTLHPSQTHRRLQILPGNAKAAKCESAVKGNGWEPNPCLTGAGQARKSCLMCGSPRRVDGLWSKAVAGGREALVITVCAARQATVIHWEGGKSGPGVCVCVRGWGECQQRPVASETTPAGAVAAN